MRKGWSINSCYKRVFELSRESRSVQQMIEDISSFADAGILIAGIGGEILHMSVGDTEETCRETRALSEDTTFPYLVDHCMEQCEQEGKDCVLLTAGVSDSFVGGRICVRGDIEGVCFVIPGDEEEHSDQGELLQLGDMTCKAVELLLERTDVRIPQRMSAARRAIARFIFEGKPGIQIPKLREVADAYLQPPFIMSILSPVEFDEVTAERVTNALAKEYENLFAERKEQRIYVLFAGVQCESKVYGLLERLCECFAYRCSVSDVFDSQSVFGGKIFMCTRALEIGSRLDPQAVCYHEYDYYLQIVCSCADERIGQARYLERELQRLWEEDLAKGTEFYNTLKEYLLMQNNVTAAARKLFIHRNTMIYRLGRITEYLGVNLNDPVVSHRLLVSMLLQEQERYMHPDPQ